jgi:hypothetical protein
VVKDAAAKKELLDTGMGDTDAIGKPPIFPPWFENRPAELAIGRELATF